MVKQLLKKSFYLKIIWLLAFGFSISNRAIAGKCVICDEIDPASMLTCAKGHETCKDCIEGQVRVTSNEITKGNYRRIQTAGLCCAGRKSINSKCDEMHSLEIITRILQGEQSIIELNQKLASADSECNSQSRKRKFDQVAEDPRTIETRVLRDGIIEAFNLCCPNPDCRGGLDKIEGCNAAQCETCNSRFCYLCLKLQTNNSTSHAHARAHSGDYWEHRDGHTGLVPGPSQGYQEIEEYDVVENNFTTGEKRTKKERRPYKYTDRYHWMIAREKLESLFHEGADPIVRENTLGELEPMLKERKMWPLPSGKTTSHWIRDVIDDPALSIQNKISLLQNEFIYLGSLAKSTQASSSSSSSSNTSIYTARANLVKEQLEGMGAVVLISLDVNANRGQQSQNNYITPILEEHPARAGLPEDFIALGPDQMYLVTDPRQDPIQRVGDLIWSHIAPGNMNQAGAIAFCENMGARLPTNEEYEALKRAMTQNGIYNRDAMPGMDGVPFWSSSLLPDGRFGVMFNGNEGGIASAARHFNLRVRCVQ